jgi:hypothetical protein
MVAAVNKHPTSMTIAEPEALPIAGRLFRGEFYFRDRIGGRWRVGHAGDGWARSPSHDVPIAARAPLPLIA